MEKHILKRCYYWKTTHQSLHYYLSGFQGRHNYGLTISSNLVTIQMPVAQGIREPFPKHQALLDAFYFYHNSHFYCWFRHKIRNCLQLLCVFSAPFEQILKIGTDIPSKQPTPLFQKCLSDSPPHTPVLEIQYILHFISSLTVFIHHIAKVSWWNL